MSTERKYQISHQQFDTLLDINEKISRYGLLLSVCIVLLIINTIFFFMFGGNAQSIRKIFIVLFTIGTLISTTKILILKQQKKTISEQIKKTAHYEVIINEK